MLDGSSAAPADPSATIKADSARGRRHSRQRVAVGGALTAVTMALVHAALGLPVECTTLVFHASLRSGSAASPEEVAVLFKLQHSAKSLMSVGSLADFIIYYYRIRAFRETLAFICKCSTHQVIDRRFRFL